MTRKLTAIGVFLFVPSLLLACATDSDDGFEPVAEGELNVGTAPVPTATPITFAGTIAANTTGSVLVSCPANTIVTDGSFGNPNKLFVFGSTKVGNGWQVSAANSSSVAKSLSASVICLSGVSGASTQVTNYVNVPSGMTGCATATCSSGLATGGGHIVSAAGTNLVYVSQPTLNNGWVTCSQNVGTSSAVLRSYATCLTNSNALVSRVDGTTVSVAPGAYGDASSVCPGGTAVVGGGYRMSPGRWNVTYSRSMLTYYTARARNDSTTAGLLYVSAKCLSVP